MKNRTNMVIYDAMDKSSLKPWIKTPTISLKNSVLEEFKLNRRKIILKATK
jgi:hypothetical protein